MIRMAGRLGRREQRRLQRKTEKAKERGGVSASLFLESEMNALSDASCFFFCGSRLRPKGLLTVFFPDEERAELTVAEFRENKAPLGALFQSAIKECGRVFVKQIYTVRDPACGFDLEKVKGICFVHEWSEYMLRIGMKKLAEAEPGCFEKGKEIKKEEAPEGDGTLRYVLICDGAEAAECRVLVTNEGRQCYLFGLETKPEFRNKGMATGLMAGIAKEYAGIPDTVLRLQVSSQNVPAERLYRKLGFVTEEEREYYRTEVSDGNES
ncbi:MAG: GNAT family N-acetyltransferase [Lachnospiraceae bacterium]|nr:GNAT family N-acetyltransferase [Lachnospiraceae bacterium]